jgi:hypothetical protein
MRLHLKAVTTMKVLLHDKKWTMFLALAFDFFLCDAAFSRDSSRIIFSGVAEFVNSGSYEKIGISIDLLDVRARGGIAREYIISSIYQNKLFQGSIIDKSDNYRKGKIILKNSQVRFFVATFKLEMGQNNDYTMELDGKINDNPAGGKTLYPAQST